MGYSSAWLHHKGRNKHHYEYWIDYSENAEQGGMAPVPMPKRYIAEMVMDRIAASKVYKGKDYTDASPLEYLKQGTSGRVMHDDTRVILEKVLTILAEEGEEEMFRYIKTELIRGK